MAVTPYQMPDLAAFNRPIADPNSGRNLKALQNYAYGLLTDPMARAEFGTGLLQGATTDLVAAPVDIYSGAVDFAQAITPQNAPQNRFFMTNPFYMLSQSGDLAEQASSIAGSEALGKSVFGNPIEGYQQYRNPARLIGGAAGAGELALGKASATVAPYLTKGINYLTDAMPKPQVATPDGLLMDAPQQIQAQPQTLLMEGDAVPSATQTVDNVPAAIDEAIVGVKNLINKTDEAKAAYNASPNDPALRKKYLDLRRQRDEQMSALPDDAELKVEADYRMQHQPRNVEEGGARLDDMTGGGQVFPDDVYSSKGFEYYGDSASEASLESYNIIKSVRNKPDEEITIYRAVPKGVTDINEGDWVTLSQKYAQDHAESGYGADGKEAGEVISKVVKVRDVVNDGNDFNEFGYFPETNPTIVGAQKAFQKPTKENPVTAVAPTETETGIIAFHGSGADFDEFQLDYIGTGEGAQAYGYGLYFTDSEDIAKFYRNAIGGSGYKKIDYSSDTHAAKSIPDIDHKEVDGYKSYSIDKANDVIKSALKMQRFNVEPDENALNIFEMTFERDGALQIDMRDGTSISLLKNFEGDSFTVTPLKKAEGKIYKVALEPKPEDLLDYDKSLKAQPKFYNALKPFYEEYGVAETADIGTLFESIKSQRGISPEGLSEKLSDAGIKGIKYRAAGSRSAGVDDAAAERNYVIFDDRLIKIMEKYGIPAGVSVTAVKGAMQDTDEGLLSKDQPQPQGLL